MAVNVDVVPTINDLVGGVDVDVLEDLTLHDPSLMKGSHVHLMGESAYWYVKYRDIHQFASVDMRAQRQAQYLNGFINAAKQTVREDPLLVFQLYEELAPQMDTNITKAEMAYIKRFYTRISLLLFLLYGITGCGQDSKENTVIATESATDSEIDFTSLKKENPNIFAWLYIPDTQIDCPVLQDNQSDDFYSNHNAFREESSQGAVYIELANVTNMCDFNTVLHGGALLFTKILPP